MVGEVLQLLSATSTATAQRQQGVDDLIRRGRRTQLGHELGLGWGRRAGGKPGAQLRCAAGAGSQAHRAHAWLPAVRVRLVAPSDALRDTTHVPYFSGNDRARHEDFETARIGKFSDYCDGLRRLDKLRLRAVPTDRDRLVVGDSKMDGDKHTGVPAPQFPCPLVSKGERRQHRHAVDAAIVLRPAAAARCNTRAHDAPRVALPCDVYEVCHHRQRSGSAARPDCGIG
jgi:hypothetical protein